MPIYKGIEIDAALAGIVRHMQGVEDYREVLGKLQGAWDNLTLLGQLTGTATEMSGTREAFQRLTGDLLNHLGRETRNKAVAELRGKTQNAIDVLVRNLFERTADIGFLSADDDVRDFLLAPAGGREALQARLREYVAKYSVYSDIVLFDCDGGIRARLQARPGEGSAHPLLAEALTTRGQYVEFFGEADFLPPGQHLVYAYRVEDGDGGRLGVLALVFRLGDEMRGIFAKLLAPQDASLLACVAADGAVIASSSPIQLPLGTRLETGLLVADGSVIRFAGREYLASACRAHGYQGYRGPGWLGLGMIPLEFAFESGASLLPADLDGPALEAVLRHPGLFSEELRSIPRQAESIQEDLNRSVWNGSVRQMDPGQGKQSFAKTLLWEISNAGRKTQAVFEQSIGNLHQTVVAALLHNSVSRAAFAIDVMDRNLYERANDCRWWAQNATFRRILAGGPVAAADAALCAGVLAYINGLYTVYDNLLLFDADGVVVAVSRPERSALAGSRLGDEWVERTLAIESSQGYVVSSFAPSALYGGRATYVYAAAVRPPGEGPAVGGIAIVFDGAPQFAAMLADTLPRDGGGQVVAGAFAAFLQRDGRVLASSDPAWAVGSRFPLAAEEAALAAGGSRARIAAIGGTYFALGTAMSGGYREYKTSDGHVADVIALCGFPLGRADAAAAARPRRAATGQGRVRQGGGGDAVEIATFHVGRQWLGIPALEVVEAIGSDGITPTVGGDGDLVVGVKMYRDQLISVVRLDRLLAAGSPAGGEPHQIIVVRTRGRICLGLLVDELGEIPEVAVEEILAVGNVAGRDDVLTVGLVPGLAEEGDRHGMLSVLAPDRLCPRLACRGCREGLSTS